MAKATKTAGSVKSTAKARAPAETKPAAAKPTRPVRSAGRQQAGQTGSRQGCAGNQTCCKANRGCDGENRHCCGRQGNQTNSAGNQSFRKAGGREIRSCKNSLVLREGGRVEAGRESQASKARCNSSSRNSLGSRQAEGRSGRACSDREADCRPACREEGPGQGEQTGQHAKGVSGPSQGHCFTRSRSACETMACQLCKRGSGGNRRPAGGNPSVTCWSRPARSSHRIRPIPAWTSR